MSLFDNGLPETCAKCGRQILVDSTICMFCGKNHGPIPDGRALRDEALQRVDENAAPDAKLAFYSRVRALRSGTEFTSEEIARTLAADGITSHEPRFTGAVMTKLTKDGLVRKTGAYVDSSNPQAHRRPVAVWVRI